MKVCLWCSASLSAGQDKWCSKRCRQTAWRFRKIAVIEDRNDTPKKLAYADPPYPGLSKKYYQHEKTYRGEVDHRDLVATLEASYDGWALSTSRSAVPWILRLFEEESIEGLYVCPWIKTHPEPKARGPANVCEFVIVRPGRRRQPGPRDSFVGAVARGGDSNLIGRKPINFINWVFQLLGASPVDALDDLYPGSGIVGRCWEEFRRQGRQERR